VTEAQFHTLPFQTCWCPLMNEHPRK
jgi:hypothetical protein